MALPLAEQLAVLDQTQLNLVLSRMREIQGTPEDAGDPPVATLEDYIQREFPTPPILIEPGLVVRGELTLTTARAGKGKTSLNFHRLLKWAAGRPMFKQLAPDLAPVDGPLKVLVIENEGAAALMQQKLKTMLAADVLNDRDKRTAAQNFLVWGDGGYSSFRVDDDPGYDLLRRACETWKPDIVFLEPFRMLWRGDEGDTQAMSSVLTKLSNVAVEFECAVMVSHHSRQSTADSDLMDVARGSTALEGHVAAMEVLEDAGLRDDRDYRKVSYAKSRYAAPPKPFYMTYDHTTTFYNYHAEEPQLGDPGQPERPYTPPSDDGPRTTGGLTL